MQLVDKKFVIRGKNWAKRWIFSKSGKKLPAKIGKLVGEKPAKKNT